MARSVRVNACEKSKLKTMISIPAPFAYYNTT